MLVDPEACIIATHLQPKGDDDRVVSLLTGADVATSATIPEVETPLEAVFAGIAAS